MKTRCDKHGIHRAMGADCPACRYEHDNGRMIPAVPEEMRLLAGWDIEPLCDLEEPMKIVGEGVCPKCGDRGLIWQVPDDIETQQCEVCCEG